MFFLQRFGKTRACNVSRALGTHVCVRVYRALKTLSTEPKSHHAFALWLFNSNHKKVLVACVAIRHTWYMISIWERRNKIPGIVYLWKLNFEFPKRGIHFYFAFGLWFFSLLHNRVNNYRIFVEMICHDFSPNSSFHSFGYFICTNFHHLRNQRRRKSD